MNKLRAVRALVTGAAGFIGSHLVDALLMSGTSVVGVDRLTGYYPRDRKVGNLDRAREHADFRFVEGDLAVLASPSLLGDVDVVFHLAAQPGVRASWDKRFSDYLRDNVLATQLLLEAARNADLRRFVYASSSSVYGDSQELPTSETAPTAPISPYGVTKLAAEQLCHAYWSSFGVPVVSLRYFSVYGPRQRPDMAFYRFIQAARQGKELVIYGDGNQRRDFTYVADAVNGTMAAMSEGQPGQVFNIGAGDHVSVRDVLSLLEDLLGTPLSINFGEPQAGDVRQTMADISKATRVLGYRPEHSLETGLAAEVDATVHFAAI